VVVVLVLASHKYHCSVLGSRRNSSAKIPPSHSYLLCLHFAFLVHPVAPPLSSREPSQCWAAERGGSWGREGGTAGLEWRQEGSAKLPAAPRDGTISALELMRNPSPPCVTWPLPIPLSGGTNEMRGDPQRHRAALGSSDDPAEWQLRGCPAVEQSAV